jgi:hypothetical protein
VTRSRDDKSSSGGNAERRRRLFEESRGLPPDRVELPLDEEETEDDQPDDEGRKPRRDKPEKNPGGGAD